MATAKYRVELAPVKGVRKYLELELKVPHATDEERFRQAMCDGEAHLDNREHTTLHVALEEWFIDQAELSYVIEFDPIEPDDD